MRSEGIWERLLEAHEAIGQDEQISLTAACEGRVKGVDMKWNLVPHWDGFPRADGTMLENLSGRNAPLNVRWRHGVPEGLIHWTGPAKPWHYSSKVWRAELWEMEQCGWEQLRGGRWDKPVAVEVEPEDDSRAQAMLRRGWRVRIHSAGDVGPALGVADSAMDFRMSPDLELAGADTVEDSSREADLLRFGPAAMPDKKMGTPERLVLEGPRTREEMESLRQHGYLGEARIRRKQWAAGGPHPKVLSYADPGDAFALGHDEDVYLSSLETDQVCSPPAAEAVHDDAPWAIPAELESCLRDRLATWLPNPGVILEFGPGHSTRVLAERFPKARIITVEHDSTRIRCLRHKFGDLPNVELHHAPIDPVLPWFDLSAIDLPKMDCVLVAGPSGRPGSRSRKGALCVAGLLNPGAVVILTDTDREAEAADCGLWQLAGLEKVEEVGSHCLLRMTSKAVDLQHRPGSEATHSSENIVDAVYLISVLDHPDSLRPPRAHRIFTKLHPKIVTGVNPAASDIRWEEMRGLEAHGYAENLRRNYVVKAVAHKRSWIRALEMFVTSGEESALICEDDCRWTPGAPKLITKALSQLPDRWDLLYFSAHSREEHLPYSPHLVKLQGARGSTAILWRRKTALSLLPEITACDCEFDVIMQRVHARCEAFCVVPMPAYQSASRQDTDEFPCEDAPIQ
jgi:hypothetical protein